MNDPFSLQGRVALVTGATGGIGRATVDMFARVGAVLVVSSNEEEACHAMAEALRRAGTQAHALPVDLADRHGVHAMAEQAIALAGHVDVLVCNGGMEGHVGPIGEATADAIETLLSVNLLSAMTLTATLAPAMATRGSGSIVLVSSIAGLRGNKAIGLYGVTKAALAQLARTLAVEFGPCGVRANTVSPGLIATPFARPILDNPDYLPRRLSLTPLRRPGRPEEVAAAILFLASEAGGFVTGHNLVADGGTTISDGN